MWNNRYQSQPNPLRPFGSPFHQQFPQQPQSRRLPWQVGRMPNHSYQGLIGMQQQQQQNAVGDEVAVGNPQVQPQTPYTSGGNPFDRFSFPANPRYQPINNQRPSTKPQQRSHTNREMRSRQLKYNTLTQEEQKQQDEWACEQIRCRYPNPCPAGLSWIRQPAKNRYICTGGAHIMTDEKLARGGRCSALPLAEVVHNMENYNLKNLEKMKKEMEQTGGSSSELKALRKGIEREKKRIKKKKGFFF